MTEDQIVELAIQGHAGTRDAIKWAIREAIRQEREACAKVCDKYNDERYANMADLCADAIRSRK